MAPMGSFFPCQKKPSVENYSKSSNKDMNHDVMTWLPSYMDLLPTSSPNFTFIVKHLARTAAILVDPPARDWTRCESSSFRHGSPSNTLGKGADLGLLGYDFA